MSSLDLRPMQLIPDKYLQYYSSKKAKFLGGSQHRRVIFREEVNIHGSLRI